MLASIFYIVSVRSSPIRRRLMNLFLVFGVDVVNVKLMSMLASTSHFWFENLGYVSIHECKHIGVE